MPRRETVRPDSAGLPARGSCAAGMKGDFRTSLSRRRIRLRRRWMYVWRIIRRQERLIRTVRRRRGSADWPGSLQREKQTAHYRQWIRCGQGMRQIRHCFISCRWKALCREPFRFRRQQGQKNSMRQRIPVNMESAVYLGMSVWIRA